MLAMMVMTETMNMLVAQAAPWTMPNPEWLQGKAQQTNPAIVLTASEEGLALFLVSKTGFLPVHS